MFKNWVGRFFRKHANFSDGITAHGHTGAFVIKAVLRTVLVDADAMKSLWRFKGSSGTKPCQFYMNVVAARSRHVGGRFLSVESTDVAAFCLQTDQTIWDGADKLA